jgi:hypothetical protein
MRPIKFHIELPLTSEWRHVELLRTSVLNCLTTIFSSSDFCRTIGMVTGELLENALKYGEWESGADFRLHVYGVEDRVTIEVYNSIAPGGPEVEALMATLRYLQAHSSARAAFLERLGKLHEDPDTRSGLGLLRIAYEGNCTLEASVEGNVVRVCATTRP